MRRQIAEQLKLLDAILLPSSKVPILALANRPARAKREQVYLTKANNGNVLAQYACGVYYMSAGKLDSAIYWFCVAEHNDFEDATSYLDQIAGSYPESVQQTIESCRADVAANPVRQETMTEILARYPA